MHLFNNSELVAWLLTKVRVKDFFHLISILCFAEDFSESTFFF